MIFDVVIIGAGASGLMLASNLKDRSVCIVDVNTKIAEKIKVSGGAKCNITNKSLSEKNYLGERTFVKEVLSNFSNSELLEFLAKNGVNPTLNPKIVKGTYFCNSSKEPIDMFSRLTSHVKKFLDTKVLDVDFKDGKYLIKTTKATIWAKRVVVASGGLSYSSLGASSIGYDIAKKFGHTITRCEPALVGFTVQKDQFWFKNLSGLSLDVVISVENKRFQGSFLFTHKGCSGPTILNSSLYWKKGKLLINFAPKIDLNRAKKSNQLISKAIRLPRRFITEFLLAIRLEDKPISSLNSEEFEKLKSIQNYEFSPAGNFGFTKAEVTRGGVNLDEIDSKSLESKIQKNLYFIGEVLDVTGELGGYNFQWAFSCAVTLSKVL